MSTLPVEQGQLPRSWPVIATAIMLAASAALVVVKDPGMQRGVLGLAYLGFLALMVFQDLRTRHVSNQVTYPALGLAVAGSLILGMDTAREALLGGGVAFVVLFIIALLGRGAMGIADVKVGAFCGIIIGLHGIIQMLFVTFAFGGLLAAILLALRLRKRKDVIAYVPFLAGGTLFTMWYFHLYLW